METINNLLNIQIAGRVAASTSMILIGSYLFLVVEVVANHHTTHRKRMSRIACEYFCCSFHSLDRVSIRRFFRYSFVLSFIPPISIVYSFAVSSVSSATPFAVCSFAISCAVVLSTYNFDCCLLRGKKYILYDLCSNIGTNFKVLVPITGDIFYTH